MMVVSLLVPANEKFVMDLSYDRLLAQIRHEIAKFFLIHTSYFGRFGPNKIRLK